MQASSTDGSEGRQVLDTCLVWDFSGARSGPMTAAVAGFSSAPWPEFGPPHTPLCPAMRRSDRPWLPIDLPGLVLLDLGSQQPRRYSAGAIRDPRSGAGIAPRMVCTAPIAKTAVGGWVFRRTMVL